MALRQLEESYESQQQRGSSRRDALKELAGRILNLSYSDMKQLAAVYAASNATTVFEDRLISTAKRLLEEERR